MAFSAAVDRAVLHGCESLQIFSKNASRWQAPPLEIQTEVRRFRRRLEESGITPAVSHASYLINLAATAPALRDQSIASLVDEIDRAHTLGLLGVFSPPGHLHSRQRGRRPVPLVAEALGVAFAHRPDVPTMVLLEHTAGQGRTLGYRFDHLAHIIDRLGGSPRVGVCLDTCHLIASGYDIRLRGRLSNRR